MNLRSATRRLSRRAFVVAACVGVSACAVVPRSPEPVGRPVEPQPRERTGASDLPIDTNRHRIALLVPTSGENGAVGQAIANATTMALLDTGSDTLRITTYDTAGNAQDAARRAVEDGAELILGPLLGRNVPAVQSAARTADVPIITFSNDASYASPDVFVIGQVPEQGIARSVRYAQQNGSNSFAVLTPEGEYGRRVEAAMRTTVPRLGGVVRSAERYDRGNTSIVSAAQRLSARGIYDAVVIADDPRLSGRGADAIRAAGERPQIIGTELWSGESAVLRAPSLRGAIFSAVSDTRYRQFVNSYEARFGVQPYRVATLGYDAVLLTLRVARDWPEGGPFPLGAMRAEGGFLGLDGAFRFGPDNVAQRAFEVRRIENGRVVVVDPAPTGF